MKRSVIRALAALLMLLMVAGMLPMSAFAAVGDDTGVWVGGVRMKVGYYLPSGNSPKAEDLTTTTPTGGHAYMEDAFTLVLNDYSYEGTGYKQTIAGMDFCYAIYYDDLGNNDLGFLTIKLQGTNSVINTEPGAERYGFAIMSITNLTLTGGGSIYAKGSRRGINAAGLDVINTTVTAESATMAFGLRPSLSGYTYGVLVKGGDDAGSARVIDDPAEDYFSGKYASISPKPALGTAVDVWVGGVQMAAGYYLPGGDSPTLDSLTTTEPTGGYAFMKDATTLVLKDYSYKGVGYKVRNGNEYNYHAILSDLSQPLIIELQGTNSLENTITGAGNYGSGIHSKGDLTLTGTGSLTVSGAYTGVGANGDLALLEIAVTANAVYYPDRVGIYSQKDLTITNSTVTASGGDNGLFGGNSINISNSTVTASGTSNGLLGSKIISIGDSNNLVVADSYNITIADSIVTAEGDNAISKQPDLSGFTAAYEVKAGDSASGATVIEGTALEGDWHKNKYVKIAPASTVATLTGISVTTPPTKTVYTAGESFDPAGMVVTASYSNRTTAPVTGYTVTDGDNLTAGKTSVTINYTEGGVTKTATQAITVNAASLTVYTITYKLNDGQNHPDNPATYTIESEKITLGSPSRTGYTFEGWFTEPELTNKKESIEKGSTGNLTLYAKWEIINYDITYTLNGGQYDCQPEVYNIESETFELRSATRKGYTFEGWFTEPELTNKKEKIESGSTGDLDLYAKWTPVDYTITYELNGGQNHPDNPATYTIESEKITLGRPSRGGYSFVGWYAEPSFEHKTDSIASGSTGDVTLYARWAKKTTPATTPEYILTFNAAGGSKIPSARFDENTVVDLTPYAPERSGHRFAGWYADKSLTRPITSVKMTGNITVYAGWTELELDDPEQSDKPEQPDKPEKPITGSAKKTRLAGNDRIATAIEISKAGYDKADTVVLASGYSYPDALAGTSYAAAVNAPVLLTAANDLDARTLAEIERLGAKRVTILGGKAAIGEAVENALRSRGITVTRLAGDDRYGTANAIAAELAKLTDGRFDTIYLASGVNYPDALSISPVAAIESNPVLFVPANGILDKATADYINSTGCKNIVILGGTAAVGANAESSLKTLGMNVERIYGADRYATSLAIAKRYGAVFTGKDMSIATGKAFPDALAGAAFAAQRNMPVVLVGSNVPSELAAYATSRQPETLFVFGGDAAVSDGVVNGLVG